MGIITCSNGKTNEDTSTELSASQTLSPGAEIVTITDALGQELSFNATPQKIAAISPTATEMLYAAGGRSILRDRSSNYPQEVNTLPHVGSAYDPSIETITAAEPDIVIIEALTQARFVSSLKSAGLKVMAVKAETVKDVKRNILNIGKVIRSEAVAKKTIADIENRLENAGSDYDSSILILISDQDRNLYAARPESYTGLIASTLGMTNKAAGLADSGPYPGFAMMSPELVLKADPDVIVTLSPAPHPAPRLSESITRIPPFASLKAMRTQAILEGDVPLFLQAPGPRIVEAVEFLKEWLNSLSP